LDVQLNLNTVLQTVIILLLAGGIKGIFAMNEKLNKMNGSIGKLWTWKEEHEKLDITQHDTLDKNVTSIWDQINTLIGKK
tara:strand:- start:541 stop:780 length:240 start_codon:yes stop_codon:yes gene_type:complete